MGKSMLQETQRSLHHDILQDGAWRNVNGTSLIGYNDDSSFELHIAAQLDVSSNGKMVELDNLGNAWNLALEARNLFKVTSKLDQRSTSNPVGVHDQLAVLQSIQVRLDEHEVGASLDWQEAATWDVDAVSILKVTNGCTDCSLKLNDSLFGLALFVSRNGLFVGDDFHGKFIVLDNTLNGTQVHPNVVGVEVLELLDRLELVDVLL